MRTRFALLAVLSASLSISTTGCNNDNSNRNDKADLRKGDRDLTGGDEDLGEGPADLRRARDLTSPNSDEDMTVEDVDMTGGGGDVDMTGGGSDVDMTGGGSDVDMTGGGGGGDVDMTGGGGGGDMAVAGGGDMATGGGGDMLTTGDMLMPPVCAQVPTLDVKSMTVSGLAWSANGSDTVKFPLGFAVTGSLTLTDGETLLANANGIRVRLIDRFTGQAYETTIGSRVNDGTNNLIYTYSLVAPAGEYYVTTRFAFVWDDGAADAQLVVLRTEPNPITVCGATTANAVHDAVPALLPRKVEVSGLAGAYNTPGIDPDPDNNRLFYGGLYLESTDGRLVFYKDDSGYTSTANQNVLQFLNWPLPVSNTGFVVQPTFAALLFSTNDNGWSHTFRFDNTKNITFSGTPGADAFTALSINSSQLVTIAGQPSDTSGRLFKPWTGFTNEFGYILHSANCHQTLPADDLFIAPTNTGDFYTDNQPYSFPVKKNAACDFFGGVRVRLPLATNQGGSLSPPANIANVSGNDIFILIAPTTNLPVTGNTTQNISVPNLTGDIVRTINVQNNAGTPLQNVVVQAEASSLSDFPTYAGRADGTVTNVSGQVTINVLKGSYFVTLEAQ